MAEKGNPNWQQGVSGNPNGRPVRPEIAELRLALDKAKALNGDKSFLEHFCERAFTDTNIAIALAKKLLPDLSEQDYGAETMSALAALAAEIRRKKGKNAK